MRVRIDSAFGFAGYYQCVADGVFIQYCHHLSPTITSTITPYNASSQVYTEKKPKVYIDICQHSHLQPPDILLLIPSYCRGCCCI